MVSSCNHCTLVRASRANVVNRDAFVLGGGVVDVVAVASWDCDARIGGGVHNRLVLRIRVLDDDDDCARD